MKQKKRFLNGIIVIALLIIFPSLPSYCSNESPKINMTEEEYQGARHYQDQYHQIYRAGNQAEKRGEYDLAIRYYEKGLSMVQGYGPETIFRSKLRTSCELGGYYEKALAQAEWFLNKSNEKSPLWPDYLKTKQRLLQKIEAQKRGEKVPGLAVPVVSQKSQPIKHVSDFHTASYGEQKQFMEKNLPEDTEIQKLSKQAMLAEHAGKFQEAQKAYAEMLARKDELIVAQGEAAWAMLHSAVQRMSELTGDETREKEALVWIRDNMISPKGSYYQYLNGLLPNVQDHLKKRLKDYSL